MSAKPALHEVQPASFASPANTNAPQTTRRQFIKMALAGAAGAYLSRKAFAGEESSPNPLLNEIGIIGTVSKEMRADYRGTLRHLSDIGYKLIETGRYSGESASAYLEYLEQLGMRVIASGGTPLAALKKDPAEAWLMWGLA